MRSDTHASHGPRFHLSVLYDWWEMRGWAVSDAIDYFDIGLATLAKADSHGWKHVTCSESSLLAPPSAFTHVSIDFPMDRLLIPCLLISLV